MSNLVVVGSVAFDAIETPFGKTDKIIGGAGTYIALSASNFNVNTKLISVVGGDFPEEYLVLLKSKNINIDGIQVLADKKTFFWSGKYHDNMNKRDTLITELNVLADFDPIIPDSYQDCDYLMLGNLSPEVQQLVLERITNKPKLIVLDTMNFWMNISHEALLKVISMVDVLTVNDEEARQLSGEYSLVTAAKRILKMGPKYLIIKKGEHGALLFSNTEMFYAPALPMAQVYDPTGAGDTFAGGFIGYIAEKDNTDFNTLKNAMIAASALASFCVEKFGTEQLNRITPKLFESRIQQFINLSTFNYL